MPWALTRAITKGDEHGEVIQPPNPPFDPCELSRVGARPGCVIRDIPFCHATSERQPMLRSVAVEQPHHCLMLPQELGAALAELSTWVGAECRSLTGE